MEVPIEAVLEPSEMAVTILPEGHAVVRTGYARLQVAEDCVVGLELGRREGLFTSTGDLAVVQAPVGVSLAKHASSSGSTVRSAAKDRSANCSIAALEIGCIDRQTRTALLDGRRFQGGSDDLQHAGKLPATNDC